MQSLEMKKPQSGNSEVLKSSQNSMGGKMHLTDMVNIAHKNPLSHAEPTMSSREIAELTGKQHKNVKRDIENMLHDLEEDTLKFEHIYFDSMNRKQTEYLLDRDHTECLLTGYSAKSRMKVIKRWHELEESNQPKLPVTYKEALLALVQAEEEKEQLQLENQEQSKEIDDLKCLFKQGSTIAAFCKMLNGVNTQQVNAFLSSKQWLYRDKRGWRVASYARDRYLTETQDEVSPHGREAFITYKVALLQSGAQRLYEMYRDGKLPMKKTWDGGFTHLKFDRPVAEVH